MPHDAIAGCTGRCLRCSLLSCAACYCALPAIVRCLLSCAACYRALSVIVRCLLSCAACYRALPAIVHCLLSCLARVVSRRANYSLHAPPLHSSSFYVHLDILARVLLYCCFRKSDLRGPELVTMQNQVGGAFAQPVGSVVLGHGHCQGGQRRPIAGQEGCGVG